LIFIQIAYALDTKNQKEAAKLNEHMSNLTTETVDDSATVKLITIFSLVYLPANFVGTLYGMNFFWHNDRTGKIVVASDFWIYVVTFIGLTAITIFIYLVFVLRNKKRRKRVSDRSSLVHSKWA